MVYCSVTPAARSAERRTDRPDSVHADGMSQDAVVSAASLHFACEPLWYPGPQYLVPAAMEVVSPPIWMMAS
jgi:hypothetical protein